MLARDGFTDLCFLPCPQSNLLMPVGQEQQYQQDDETREVSELRFVPFDRNNETCDEGTHPPPDSTSRPGVVDNRLDGQQEDGWCGKHEMVKLDDRRQRQTTDQIPTEAPNVP